MNHEQQTDDERAAEPGQTDTCPAWAVALIHRIAELEVQLGNLNPDGPWQVTKISDVYHRLSAEDSELDAALVDQLFARISKGLADEGFSAAAIATFINSRIPSGRLPYCDHQEVSDALAAAPPS